MRVANHLGVAGLTDTFGEQHDTQGVVDLGSLEPGRKRFRPVALHILGRVISLERLAKRAGRETAQRYGVGNGCGADVGGHGSRSTATRIGIASKGSHHTATRALRRPTPGPRSPPSFPRTRTSHDWWT